MACGNSVLAKVAVQCSADTFVIKIATFAKPQNVGGHCEGDTETADINQEKVKITPLRLAGL